MINIKQLLVILISQWLLASCNEVSLGKDNKEISKNLRNVELQLIDSLGVVNFYLPLRYDTSFSWIKQSDCGKPCEEQKYRFQPKTLPITKETGWVWLGEPKDSIERFTITHAAYLLYKMGDTSKNMGVHNFFKEGLASHSENLPIIFDTVEKINGRYYSIFAMQKSDTIQSQKVLAITTIRGNNIRFQYDLLTMKNDSISKNFIKNSIDLIRTIHFSKGI